MSFSIPIPNISAIIAKVFSLGLPFPSSMDAMYPRLNLVSLASFACVHPFFLRNFAILLPIPNFASSQYTPKGVSKFVRIAPRKLHLLRHFTQYHTNYRRTLIFFVTFLSHYYRRTLINSAQRFFQRKRVLNNRKFISVMTLNRLREVMLLKRITQEELSKRTGIRQGEISKIINDQKEIYLSTAKRIAKALGKSVDYLWPD